MRKVLAVAILCCLVSSNAIAQRKTANPGARDEQLALLDSEAGLVISLQLSQLAAAHKLALALVPKERQALSLAGLAAGAILGFYPFDPKAWTTSGFDIESPMVLQIAAAGPRDSLLKTRVVLKARRGDRALRTIERMRLQDKARPHASRDDLAGLFSQIPGTPDARTLGKELGDASVFLVARPRPLQGLLFAQRRGDFIILDIFDPSGSDYPTIMALLRRKPGALRVSMGGAEALLDGPVGVWLRTAPMGASLERLAKGDTKRERACGAVATLGRKGSIEAVGIRTSLAPKQISLDATWHLRPGEDLLAHLETRGDPVLDGHKVLDAKLNLTSWGRLRDRKRPTEAQSWDLLWAQSKACGPATSIYAMTASWPEILGLFLSEVSALHPYAKTAIDSAGGMSAQIGVAGEQPPAFFTEMWVRGKGAPIAKGWLKTLFGSEEIQGRQYRWGNGSIRPYALDKDAGSIVGAGYRRGSRTTALAATRPKAVAVNPVLAQARANPTQIARLAPTLPAALLWRHWSTAVARLVAGQGKVELSLSLQR
ncbi:MAG: hypothetical protein GY811_28710 [Myxococcales bacterium]|nr:hypothetical protein [Myxococcales bacterium]